MMVPARRSAPEIEEWLRQTIADLLSVSPEAIAADEPFSRFGLDSLAAVSLSGSLADWLGVPVAPTIAWDYPTIRDVAAFLAEGKAPARAAKPLARPQTSPTPRAPVVRSMRLRPAVQFSVSFFSSQTVADAEGSYRLVLEAARFADRQGFTAVWTPERHFHPFGGLFPNPAVLGAALAAVTKRVRIRAGSVVLPLHHPLRVAEEWAVVDRLSDGRVDLAFASGWNPQDFLFAPERYAERRRYVTETIQTLRELWTGAEFRGRGPDGREVAVRPFPPPVQRELPLWLTAAQSPETFAEAGRSGANVLTGLFFHTLEELAEKIGVYREARAKSGLNPAAGTVTLMLHTFLADDSERARELVRQPFTAYLESSVDLWRHASEDLRTLSTAKRQELLDYAFERYSRSAALFGTPEDCLDMVFRARDAGVDEIACLIDFGVDTERVLQSLPHLAKLREAAVLALETPTGVIRAFANREEPVRLYCLPHSGGSHRLFDGWNEELGADVEVVPICLPGRDGRREATPLDRMQDIVAWLEREVSVPAGKPCAIFGHSQGGLIAFEWARALASREDVDLRAVVVSSCAAPQLPRELPGFEHLPDEQLASKFLEHGPRQVVSDLEPLLRDPRERRAVGALLRADLRVLQRYRYEAGGAPLRCPIFALGGLADDFVSNHDLAAWNEHTSAFVMIRRFPGDHFFLRTARKPLLTTLRRALLEPFLE
jgi:natural product biosynthesis luciferase-like monooxygenase protein